MRRSAESVAGKYAVAERSALVPSQRFTFKEAYAALSDKVTWDKGPYQRVSWARMEELKDKAFHEADKTFGPFCSVFDDPNAAGQFSRNDGHNDAFRHCYWNALMTRTFGKDFAAEFATAHESLAGNQVKREAMDLYNNEVGRGIAEKNPKASEEELARLVRKAVQQGQVVVIDKLGILRWSDEIQVGHHGKTPPDHH